MIGLTSSTCNAEQRCLRDSIDASAEREGLALEWLEEQLGEPVQPMPLSLRTVVLRRQRYPWLASVRAHDRIASATVPELARHSVARTMYLTTPADRARRRIRRQRRRLLLKQLRRMPANAAVTLKQASELVDAGERTLFTARQKGELHWERSGLIPVVELRRFLERRVA